MRLLAPLLSFTAEEVWGHMGRAGSVHIAFFPEPAELTAGIAEAGAGNARPTGTVSWK